MALLLPFCFDEAQPMIYVLGQRCSNRSLIRFRETLKDRIDKGTLSKARDL